MAANGEKRSPTAHRTKSQMREHGRTYSARPEQKKNRAARNKARRTLMKEGKVKKGDGKDVGHKTPLSKGGSNDRKNMAVQSRKSNRGHGMSKKRARASRG
jgi:hypothetical protein